MKTSAWLARILPLAIIALFAYATWAFVTQVICTLTWHPDEYSKLINVQCFPSSTASLAVMALLLASSWLTSFSLSSFSSATSDCSLPAW